MMNRNYLENFLAKEFKGEKITFEGEGWGSCAFTVGENIVRFSKNNDISSYEKEQYIYGFLRNKIRFQMPQINIVYGEINYSIHKKLIGENWNIDTYNKLSDKNKSLFCGDIAEFFYEVHSTNLKELDEKIIKKPVRLTIDDFINFLKDDFNIQEIDNLYKYYCKVLDSGNDFVLAHQDFYEANSLVNKDHRLKIVFDFGNCGITERCLEFRTLTYYDDMFKRVIKNYETISGVKIDITRIDDLNNIDPFGCLNYLHSTSLKDKMINEWNENIENARILLKKIE